MKGFRSFLEMTDAINEPAGTRVAWENDGSGGMYYFDIDGDTYSMSFSVGVGTTELGPEFRFKKVEVTLAGPRNFRLTYKFQAPRVYREVIRGFKAMIAKFNPELIIFSAFDETTIPLYRSLYERFLKPYYTQIYGGLSGMGEYLRNDLYEKYNKGYEGSRLQSGMEAAKRNADRFRKQRDADRKYRRETGDGGI